ncbi:FAD:protein FMN transferase [Sphingobium sp. H39-3-25]|uniref:FAD:protein FMN transferase n=1 Tax=Sphingobium arseniciresistens TaxID=3030834 RepID=UPI0023B97871|nr:FAD:protein FMN transferase [Sphingobium arseniciresistens]
MTKESYHFSALGSPCEVKVQGAQGELLALLGRLAEEEVARIERKYSRYRADSLLSRVNADAGRPVPIDSETHGLLHYADQCWRLSDGLFDVTSGVLRRVWKFDGSDKVPAPDAVAAVMPLIGWDKVELSADLVRLREGMEIDLGGLGKEYAVDRVALMLAAHTDLPVLVNFGGDLRVSGPRRDGEPWLIAIEAVRDGDEKPAMLELRGGALTTSGDARRFLLRDGVRYSHILDPRTGWPVTNPPHSVTIAAATCLEAGIMSTLAMLHGERAEAFLERERTVSWLVR